jgi:SnoaL-like domain
MTITLPKIIETYVLAKNAHDIKNTLACFSKNAVVHDEGQEMRGIKKINEWLESTTKKYNVHLRPVKIVEKGDETILTTEVSGTFEGSPIELDFHFTIEYDKITVLSIH